MSEIVDNTVEGILRDLDATVYVVPYTGFQRSVMHDNLVKVIDLDARAAQEYGYPRVDVALQTWAASNELIETEFNSFKEFKNKVRTSFNISRKLLIEKLVKEANGKDILILAEPAITSMAPTSSTSFRVTTTTYCMFLDKDVAKSVAKVDAEDAFHIRELADKMDCDIELLVTEIISSFKLLQRHVQKSKAEEEFKKKQDGYVDAFVKAVEAAAKIPPSESSVLGE